jgi:hypothetical protein
VKLHDFAAARPVPSLPRTPVETTAEYTVPGCSGADGVNVAVKLGAS